MQEFPAPLSSPSGAPLTVAELNRLAREALESRLPLLWVSGEISNLTMAGSGHAYFTLKDSSAQVRCVMFRSRVQLLGWRPENGQRVDARALVTLYEARGDYQLNVETLRQSGTGRLYEEFVRLKIRLDKEGLFAPERKRPLPVFPRTIGIVSSPQAAALRDVVATLARRAPQVGLILYPTAVQGTGAAHEIAAAIERASQRRECDLIVVCRGGGSIEDLWSFNEEIVARAIRATPMPVIAGIGHETDFTIADFAADLRAPTPTAAAEQAAPARAGLCAGLDLLEQRQRRAMQRKTETGQQRIDYLARRLQHPAVTLSRRRTDLGHLAARLDGVRRHLLGADRAVLAALAERLEYRRPDPAALRAELMQSFATLNRAAHAGIGQQQSRIAELGTQLRHLDPNAVLGRGYSIVTTPAGEILRDASFVEPGAGIVVNLFSGRLQAKVESVDCAPRKGPVES